MNLRTVAKKNQCLEYGFTSNEFNYMKQSDGDLKISITSMLKMKMKITFKYMNKKNIKPTTTKIK